EYYCLLYYSGAQVF
nr:immunoglobulin light chain junction region [Macaca mulatta]